MKIRSPWMIRLAAWLGMTLLRLIFATCRKKFIAIDPQSEIIFHDIPGNEAWYVGVVWHDSLLLPIFTSSHPHDFCCLVGAHRDGSLLDDCLKMLRYTSVRGSSRKGGIAALKESIEEAGPRHLIITPDGPLGPRRAMKQGAAFIASATGRKVVPSSFGCHRCWRVPAKWTDLVIPKPFTTIYVIAGPILEVPADLDRAGIEQYTTEIQRRMDWLGQFTDELVKSRRLPDIPLDRFPEKMDFGPSPTSAAA